MTIAIQRCVLPLLVCLCALFCAGCAPQVRGLYEAVDQPGVTIEFFKDGTWVASGGLSGTFSVDGDRLAIRGPLGIGSTGTITRKDVTISFFGEDLKFVKK